MVDLSRGTWIGPFRRRWPAGFRRSWRGIPCSKLRPLHTHQKRRHCFFRWLHRPDEGRRL